MHELSGLSPLGLGTIDYWLDPSVVNLDVEHISDLMVNGYETMC